MSTFPDWQKCAVEQRRKSSGCIPTGYEMILRAAGVGGIDFKTFQDDFDLDKARKADEQPHNNFDSVGGAVKAKYPHVTFESREFAKGEGDKKLAAVETMIGQKRPVLISLAAAPFGDEGWHVMAVVDSSADTLTLLNGVDGNGKADTIVLSKAKFVEIHDKFDGGGDIAFLANAVSP